MKLRILFLCTGNSCRSQMAEGWTNHLKTHHLVAFSAGTNPKRLDLRAVRAMSEVGIDISGHSPKHVRDFLAAPFDAVITVCDDAAEACPVFPGNTKVIHKSFEDPPRLAINAKTEEQAMAHYRRIRDEIKVFVEKLPEPFGFG